MRVESLGFRIGIILLALASLPSLADRKAETDWRRDPITKADVSVSARTINLKEVCRQFERQTSVEFFVDRRFADVPVALHISSARLETAMTCVEEITGLQWRLVDDMFFLTEDARGTAVVRWEERYREARKSHVSKTTQNLVDEWLYDAMPFPPSFDPMWELTPLQAEQMAYESALSIFTMTRPQLMWLNDALLAHGFRAESALPTDLLIRQSPDLTVKLNAAMLIDSPQGMLIVEKPLTAPTPKPVVEAPPKTAKVETVTEGPAKETDLKGSLTGIRLTDEKPGDLTNLLKAAKARGFDNILVPVLSRGQTLYPSDVLYPDTALIAEKDRTPDRLKPIVSQAKALGMKVHAVLDATLWGDATHPVPGAASYAVVHDRNLLDRTHSEQAQWQQSESAAMELAPAEAAPAAEKSVYLCPASSQTARLLKSLVKEIASRYEIAGICIDRLDYPRNEPFVVNGRDMAVPFGYTIEVRKAIIRAHQVDPIDIDLEGARSPEDAESQAVWDRFRRGKLTGLIAEVGQALKETKPDGIVSVVLNPDSDAQSPGHWSQVAEVDAVLPSLGLNDAGEEPMEDRADVQAANALYAYVSKYAAVVPMVHGGEKGSAVFTGLASALKPGKADRGWILAGDSSSLVKALEGLETTAGR